MAIYSMPPTSHVRRGDILAIDWSMDVRPADGRPHVMIACPCDLSIVHMRPTAAGWRVVSATRADDASGLFERLAALAATQGSVTAVSHSVPMLLHASDFRAAYEAGLLAVTSMTRRGEHIMSGQPRDILSLSAVIADPPTYLRLQTGRRGRSLAIVDVRNHIQSIGDITPDHVAKCIDSLDVTETAAAADGWRTNRVMAVVCGVSEARSLLAGASGRRTLPATAAAGGKECMLRHSPDLPGATIDSLPAWRMAWRAYHGGRVEAYGSGLYTGRVHYVDLSSQYMRICLTQDLPYRLMEHIDDVDMADMDGHLARGYCIAWVHLRNADGHYPCDIDLQSRWPSGRFPANLHHYELARAHTLGHIEHIYELAIYSTRPLLTKWAQIAIDARRRARDRGDHVAESACKSMANASIGKLAERLRSVRPAAYDVPPTAWGRWGRTDRATGESRHYIALGGEVWETGDVYASPDARPHIAGAITAIGREQIRLVMDMARPSEVLYVCTDGVIVTDRGLDSISAIIDCDSRSGIRARVVESADSCVIVSPGFYRLGGLTRHSGSRYTDAYTSDSWTHSSIPCDIDEHAGGEIPAGVPVVRCRDDIDGIIASAAATRYTRRCSPRLDLPPICPRRPTDSLYSDDSSGRW